jgi:hypothetical protein
MHELSRCFFLAGAVPFVLLGLAHALATPLTPSERKGLSPADPALPAAMAASGVLLTRRTDMWRAWVGFNLSHSLGAVLFGAFVVLAGRSQAVFDLEGALFAPAALLVSGAYLALAIKYWFRTPIAGIGLSLLLFLAAWVLFALGR